jgi:RNA polymerase sigma-70 factor (ECF subfamily)
MVEREAIAASTVEAARKGEPGAADRLVSEAWPHAYRIAYSLVHDREVAQDVAQEACAAVFAKIAQLRTAEAFAVWLYRIIVREANRWRRKHCLGQALGLIPESRDDIARSTIRTDVLQALGKLSPHQRATIVLRYYAGMNSREIASVLHIPAGSVRFHLLAARRRLEALLAEPQSAQHFLEVAHVV